MQSLKSNNDMMQKLLGEVDRLQQQNKQLAIKLKKAEYSTVVGNLKTKQTKQKTKDDTSKYIKLNKEMKQKIDTLNRLLKQKEIQNNQLNERLNTKINMDDKDRQQVIQNFKRFQGRKPNSSQDHKTMQLIQYYQLQIEKKDHRIAQLQKQCSNNISLNLTLKRQLIDKEKQNESINSNMLETKILQGDMDKIKGEIDINKLTKDIDRKNIMIDKLRADIKELRGKYQDLTKEYYQVYNQLQNSQKDNNHNKKSKSKRYEEEEQPQPLAPPKKVHKGTYDKEQLEDNMAQYEEILNKLLEIYGVQHYKDIVCSAIAADMALQNLPKMETYLTIIKQFLQSNLKTRINFSDLENHIKSLQILLTSSSLHKSIITTIFNELSLTQSSYLQSIKQLKQTNNQYLQDLKKIKFIKELSSARQIQQFIQFFNLDPEEPLNSQIVQLYQQLKSLNKFTSLANKLLDTNHDIPQCMEFILQILERYKSMQQTSSILHSVSSSAISHGLTSSSRKKLKQ